MDRFTHMVKSGNVWLKIFAHDPHHFSVRFPEFDDIRSYPGATIDYNQEQLVMFLLALDPKECLKFLKRLYEACHWTHSALVRRYRHNILLGKVWEEVMEEEKTC